MNQVEKILNRALGDGAVNSLINISTDGEDRVTGTFLGNEGRVFDFQIDGVEDEIEVGFNHSDSELVNDYWVGVLYSKGIDYHGDSAYLYYMGRQGEELRCDEGGACPAGGTRCGKICLPQGKKCRISAGGVVKGVGKAALAVGAVGGAIAAGRALMKNKNAAPAPTRMQKARAGLKAAARETNHVLRGSNFSDDQLQKIHEASGGKYGISKKHARNRKIARAVVQGVAAGGTTAAYLRAKSRTTSA